MREDLFAQLADGKQPPNTKVIDGPAGHGRARDEAPTTTRADGRRRVDRPARSSSSSTTAGALRRPTSRNPEQSFDQFNQPNVTFNFTD